MNVLRSLLASAAVVCTAAVAMAFPSVKVTYPTPGGTFDNAQYFASINASCSGATANTAHMPYMMHQAGDEVAATNFTVSKIDNATIIVNFDDTQFKSNGEWTLYFPAGSLSVAGETNPTDIAAATYTLNDPTLVAGGYPQITLISCDPADGSSQSNLGGAVSQISFKTSNNDAVNYIGWTLWDVTNGEGKEAQWFRQGSENRIDFNRTHNYDDQWAGVDPSFSIGEPATPLIAGHKYRIDLIFAGIGYDPETNQYPSPQQIEMSKELETSIYFYGLTKPTEYSPYVVESVSPDPDTYSIEDYEFAKFTVTYSGPVKPSQFTYPLGQGAGTASAGTYAAVGETDANGYSNAWEFTISESVVGAAQGSLHVSIKAEDADGLPVMGNGGYEDGQNDFLYSMDWDCTLGNASLALVTPGPNAEVETLSFIAVTNAAQETMSYGYVKEPATISDKVGNTVRVLGEPTQYLTAYNMGWEFDPITEPGEYALMIPSSYFVVGEEMTAVASKSATFVFTVLGEPSNVGDLLPASVDPADKSTVEKLDVVTLSFSQNAYTNMEEGNPVANIYKIEGAEKTLVTTASGTENDMFNPTVYTYRLADTITEEGTYNFVIEAGKFFNGVYDETMGESGLISPVYSYTYTIGGGDQPGNDKETLIPTVTPENGAVVTELSKIVISFDERVLYEWDVPGKNYTATIYKVTANGEEQVAAPTATPDSWSTTTAFTYTLTKAITEEGTYHFVLPAGTIDNADHSKTTPELSYFFTVSAGGETPSTAVADLMYAAVDPANGSTIKSFTSINLTFDEVAYCDFIKGTYAEIYKLDGENETLYCTIGGMENNFTEPTEYTFRFADIAWASEDIESFDNGTYKVVIPAGLIFDAEYKTSQGDAGHYNPEYVLTYILSGEDSLSTIFGADAELTIVNINGVVVKKNAAAADFNALPGGIYIVNGKKVIKK